MRSTPVLRRDETTLGPLALGGRTITLVTRTTAIHLGAKQGALHVRSRPAHVEVLDERGRVQIVPIRNVEHTLISTIVVGCAAGVCALRFGRPRKRSA